jgi:hypothetical protein
MPVDVESELARLGTAWSESVAHVDVAEVLERTMAGRSQPIDDMVDPHGTPRPRRRPERWSRRSGQRWLVAAACTALVAAGVVALAQRQAGGPEPAPTNPATTPSAPNDSVAPPPPIEPFVGAWESTDTDGSSQTMDIEHWGAEEYFVVLNDENAACPGGAQITGTGRLATDTSLMIARPGAYCWDTQGSSPPVSDPASITLDLAAATGELVDSFGVVWRRPEVPTLDAEDTALLQAFLGARLAGEGAEQYLLSDLPELFETTTVPPLLYATTGGAAYARFEIERVPEWETQPGWTKVEVRLFAEDGTVVEQSFHVVDQDGQHGLVYGQRSGDVSTTENWQPVPVPFSILNGEVTFAAYPPWKEDYESSEASTAFQKSSWNLAWFVIATEPLSVGTACENGPAPTDAEALARTIMADPDIEAAEPVPVRIAGIDGLQIDVAKSDYNWLCAWTPDALTAFQGGGQIRLYIVDYPGESAKVLTFAFVAGPDEWEDAIDDIVPILDSIQFHVD